MQKLLAYQMLKESNENKRIIQQVIGGLRIKVAVKRREIRHQWLNSELKRVLSQLPGDGENRSLFAWIH